MSQYTDCCKITEVWMLHVLFLVSSHFCATLYNAKFHIDYGQTLTWSIGCSTFQYLRYVREWREENLYDGKGKLSKSTILSALLSNSVPLDCTYQYSIRNARECENWSVASGFRDTCLRYSFLSASAKLRRATVYVVIFVCLLSSVHMFHLGPRWTDFHEIWCLGIFLKYVRFQALLQKCRHTLKIRRAFSSDSGRGRCFGQ
jgi:hypothetical protein